MIEEKKAQTILRNLEKQLAAYSSLPPADYSDAMLFTQQAKTRGILRWYTLVSNKPKIQTGETYEAFLVRQRIWYAEETERVANDDNFQFVDTPHIQQQNESSIVGWVLQKYSEETE